MMRGARTSIATSLQNSILDPVTVAFIANYCKTIAWFQRTKVVRSEKSTKRLFFLHLTLVLTAILFVLFIYLFVIVCSVNYNWFSSAS